MAANSMEDVYRWFGHAAEAAQLLETELGTILFQMNCKDAGILDDTHAIEARVILDRINRSTLGALFEQLKIKMDDLKNVSEELTEALVERNRLSHSFYRQHNNRRNSDVGRAIMITDLERIHVTIFTAYKHLLKIGE